MKHPARIAAAVVAVLLLTGSVALARPVHRKSFVEYLGPFLAKPLNDCRTCHVPDKPGEKPEEGADKPHNVFGARLKAVRQELLQAEKPADIASRLDAIADEDSDGDGASNRVELLSGHHPGDPKDSPTATELAEAPKKLAAFVKFRSSYPWRPFEAVQRPAVPAIRNPQSAIRNSIDAFLAAEHEERGLKPRPEAPKHVLLRRVYLDLIGLPPTSEELQAFHSDPSSDAYEKVVDRLLADPRHGERWGRHWMDVWRYSDWAGYGAEVRVSQKHIWHWRDWIVESLNADKPYDRMVLEMLAADELAPDDPDALRATGFLARNWFKFNRNVWLDDVIEHTGKAFLGVTMNCARCHDHFFDPITQEEYYQFRAIFEPHQVRTDRLPGQPDINKDGLPRVYDADLKAITYLFTRGQEHLPDKSKPIVPGVPTALGGKLKVEPVQLLASAYAPDRREFVVRETLAAADLAVTHARQALAAKQKNAGEDVKLAELELAIAEARREALMATLEAEGIEDSDRKAKEPELWKQAAEKAVVAQRRQALLEAQRNEATARRAAEQSQTAADKANADLAAKKDDKALQAAVQKADAALKAAKTKQADAEKQLAAAEKNAQAPLTTAYTKRTVPTFPTTSSGRRLALARWIVDRQNPLAARVAMNQLWLRHFGKAIVPSVFDFGRNGRLPSHPALLDWLAGEFMEPASGGRESPGWSMKHMHRLMVTSAAYRMDSNHDADNAAVDSENRYLWRMNPRRMEAELVRDSVLHVAGNLDRSLGGPDIDQNQGLTSRRRSMYFRHAAEKQMEFLYLFDAPNVTECYERVESIVPQQALALANSTLALEQSRLLARKLAREAVEPAAFIRAGFEQVLGRPPTPQEQAECEKFLTEQAARFADMTKLTAFAGGPACAVPPAADPQMRARENLIHVLLNHHEFVTIR